jgi:hypothetical protein
MLNFHQKWLVWVCRFEFWSQPRNANSLIESSKRNNCTEQLRMWVKKHRARCSFPHFSARSSAIRPTPPSTLGSFYPAVCGQTPGPAGVWTGANCQKVYHSHNLSRGSNTHVRMLVTNTNHARPLLYSFMPWNPKFVTVAASVLRSTPSHRHRAQAAARLHFLHIRRSARAAVDLARRSK